MIVRELLTRFSFSTDQAGINKVEGNIDRLSGMLQGLAAFASLRALAGVADSMQSLEARIGMLPQTVGDVGDAFNTISQRASNAKQSIDAYGSFYVKAGNATQDFITSQDQLLRVVDGAAFGLAASGATAAGQSQAFFQLGQAIASPIVQMEEMNTLIDVAPDLFRALGKAIPGANGNLKKFISTGQVTGKMLAEGLVKVMPEFEKQMRSMPMTIGTATVLINNKWSKFVNKLNRESSAVTSIATFFLDGFDLVESSMKKLVDLLGGASNTIRIFGIIAAVALAPFIASLILGAVMALPMIAAVVLIGLAIDDVITYLRGGESIFGRFLAWLKGGSLGAGILVGALTLLGAAFTAWGITTAIAFAKAGFAALAFGVNAAIGLLSVLWLPALIVAGIVAIIAIIYLLWSNWEEIWGYIGDIAAKTWTSISDGFLGMVNTLKGYWNDFKSFFGVGVSTNITAGKVAGAASSASGVAGAGNQTNANVTINQELPPGTSKETADAAKAATKMAMAGNGIDFITGGMGAYAQ